MNCAGQKTTRLTGFIPAGRALQSGAAAPIEIAARKLGDVFRHTAC
jgi:hypothetical protein